MAVPSPSAFAASRRVEPGGLFVWIAAAALAAVACYRYLQQPTFWLDEAFVAVSLRDPTPDLIFAPLRYGQYFPRIYLGAIADSVSFVVRLTPARWRTVDYGPFVERVLAGG